MYAGRHGVIPVKRLIAGAALSWRLTLAEAGGLLYREYVLLLSVHEERARLAAGSGKPQLGDGMTAAELESWRAELARD